MTPRPAPTTQLTTFVGEDRNPVWSSRRKIRLLPERTRRQLQRLETRRGASAEPRPRSRTSTKIRCASLSSSDAGDLCFGYDGEIYTLPNGTTEPKKVSIQVGFGDSERKVEVVDMSDGATEISLNPDGKEIAFVAHGEVFVASTEHGDTKRITNTPTQERSVSFSRGRAAAGLRGRDLEVLEPLRGQYQTTQGGRTLFFQLHRRGHQTHPRQRPGKLPAPLLARRQGGRLPGKPHDASRSSTSIPNSRA